MGDKWLADGCGEAAEALRASGVAAIWGWWLAYGEMVIFDGDFTGGFATVMPSTGSPAAECDVSPTPPRTFTPVNIFYAPGDCAMRL